MSVRIPRETVEVVSVAFRPSSGACFASPTAVMLLTLLLAVEAWPSFRDQFFALVNNRSEIPKVDKMHYLIGSLKRVTWDAILSMHASADNFDFA